MKNIFLLLTILVCGLFSPFLTLAQGPSDKQFQAIEKLMAPQRKKVTDILEADKTGQYKTYKADLETIAKEKDPARKKELVAKLDRDHLAFIRKSYAEAKINNTDLKRQVSQILGQIQFSFGEFADILIEVVPPNLALPERFDVTLNCPFEAIDETDNSAVVALCEAEARDCGMALESLAEIAGGCRSKGDVGGIFELPEGTFSRITTVIQSDISYSGIVLALAGYGQINGKFGIRFRAPGIDKTVFAKEVHAVAPIVWYRAISGDQDNFIAQASFTGSFSGGTSIKVQAHAEVFALCIPAFSLTEMDGNIGNIDSIRIDGSN